MRNVRATFGGKSFGLWSLYDHLRSLRSPHATTQHSTAMAAVLGAIRERQGVFEGFVGNIAKAVASHVAQQHKARTAFSLRGGAPERAVALPRRRRGRAAPYAALLPDGGVAGEVFTTSINSFLNIYNTSACLTGAGRARRRRARRGRIAHRLRSARLLTLRSPAPRSSDRPPGAHLVS